MQILKKINFLLFIPMILITSFSVISLWSLKESFAKQQLAYFIVGLVLFFVFLSLDYKIYKHYWVYLVAVSLALLISTFLVGTAVKGSHRWLNVGLFNFQPSEFSKIALIIALASLFSSHNPAKEYLVYVKSLAVYGLMAGLIFFQPDLGTFFVFSFIF
ncbi:FtsW/RodA/SpoVE family cell cycle protein, partial [candidate division WWE3 bacterium]|nr:FtsW/RodA/SpoVE family cell cycle protein [candidate division WWE3 bacterium]